MSAWTAGSGSRATLVHTVDVNWQNISTNQTSVHVNTYVNISAGSTVTNNVGDANWNVNTAGYAPGSNFTYSWGAGDHGLNTYDTTVNHDANGNCTIGVHAYVNGANSPYFTASSIDTSLALPRLALAPSINGISSDTITTNSVRLGSELNNLGHGTSAAARFYYRIQGSGSAWSQTADQNDVAGWNYWAVTGLSTAKTYEYFVRWWNNNGDTADSSTSTFQTKSGVKVILSSGTVEDRVIKQILPTGVVSDRVVTKIV